MHVNQEVAQSHLTVISSSRRIGGTRSTTARHTLLGDS